MITQETITSVNSIPPKVPTHIRLWHDTQSQIQAIAIREEISIGKVTNMLLSGHKFNHRGKVEVTRSVTVRLWEANAKQLVTEAVDSEVNLDTGKIGNMKLLKILSELPEPTRSYLRGFGNT